MILILQSGGNGGVQIITPAWTAESAGSKLTKIRTSAGTVMLTIDIVKFGTLLADHAGSPRPILNLTRYCED